MPRKTTSSNKSENKSVPTEIILRSRPPAIVAYKDGGIGIAQVAARGAGAEKGGYDLLDENEAVIAPRDVSWVDSAPEARLVLDDYPLSEQSIYPLFYSSVVRYKNRIVGYIGGKQRTEKKSLTSAANGTAFGGRPIGPNRRTPKT